jgi:hypothetical protein
MADIVGAAQKINDVEVAQDAPITEALMTKLGGNINYLLDLGIQVVTFTSSGSWTAPAGINHSILIGCGGGQGGNIDVGGSWVGNIYGGWGARGSIQYYPITPGGSYSVAIGAGGAGANGSGFSPHVGLTGSNSTISGPSGTVLFPAGYGGHTFGAFEFYSSSILGKTQGIAPGIVQILGSGVTYDGPIDGGDQGAYSSGYNTSLGSRIYLGGGAGYFGGGGYASDGSTAAGSGGANTGAGGGAGRGTFPGGDGGSGKIIAILFK